MSFSVGARLSLMMAAAVFAVALTVAALVAQPARANNVGGHGGSGGSGSGSAVVAEAKTWLGVPYVWGGASRSGVDCSGLTQQVYAAFGVSLPHNAAAQYSHGTPVSSPGAGDLVFGDYTGGGIGHVGIATGGGQMINAPYPGTTVRYDPISPEHVVGYRSVL